MPNETAVQDQDQSSSTETTQAVRDVLDGRRTGASMVLPFLGPAVVVSVAYMDPGNFATNIQAGARYGYALLWVVILASAAAMLFQSLSAKLGIVTDKNLAELCREFLPTPIVYIMWAISEVAAMATDLAEFVGGSLGLSLLFHLPLFAGWLSPRRLPTRSSTFKKQAIGRLNWRLARSSA
jgi:manganese transport protein